MSDKIAIPAQIEAKMTVQAPRKTRSSFSTKLSRVSAVFLAGCGDALLFASDLILPRLIPAFPANGAWLGQLVATGWLAVAGLNWFSQWSLLGGIYGRPVVIANAALYFITATVLLNVVVRGNAHLGVWLFFVAVVTLAAIYVWLLFRGPVESDFAQASGPTTNTRT
jgi:hypothetical protein